MTYYYWLLDLFSWKYFINKESYALLDGVADNIYNKREKKND